MKPNAALDTVSHIAYVLRELERHAANKSEFADSILNFWHLDQGEHRFQIHARVFKDMDLANYITEATA
jgi:hypothetical protein